MVAAMAASMSKHVMRTGFAGYKAGQWPLSCAISTLHSLGRDVLAERV